ncbi:coiled-coil domain-containing protein [Enterococcus faecium]|uniref:coiled-coil domain-containing protein n=1 Tax=Enterococcus faecium TaxID=1352 RepID=UPI00358FFA0F
MASSLYNLALDFSKELNYTKAIMARQGDKGITVTVKPFLNGLQMDTSGGTFTLKGTTPSNRYVDSVATSVTSEEVTFSLDGTFMSEAGYYKHCYVEYRKDDQILTTQDIIFFSLGVSDISQGQADEYVSQLEELIRKYNETFDAFLAEIKGRMDSLNKQITDLTGQAKTLQDKLDALKEEISKLGNLHVMYSDSIEFGGYDYSGNPNIAPNVGFNDFYNNGSQTGYTAKDGVDHIAVTRTADAPLAGKLLNIRTLLPNKTYTLSVDIWADIEVPSGAISCGIQLKEGTKVRTVWALIAKPVSTNRTTYSVAFTTAANFVTTEESRITFWFGNSAGECTGYLGYNIKIEEGSTATPYQPNLLGAPYYLSKVPLGENLFSTKDWQNRPPFSVGGITAMKILAEPRTEYIMSTNIPTWADNTTCDLFVFNSDGTPVSTINGVALNKPRKVTTLDDGFVIFAMRNHEFSSGSFWAKLEKGDTPTPNIEQYKYRGIGMRDSNNPKDYVWDLEPKYVEENLATESKVTEIIGEANKYTDNSIEAVNINVTNIADDLAKQINVNENAARNYTDTKKIEAVNESKKYTDEVFRKEIVNLTVKNGNLGTARLYRQGNCVTIYFFDLNGRNSGGNDSVILTVPEGYRTPISFEQLVGSTDRSAFNNAQLGFGADGNIYWRRNTSYASSYTFAVTYII